MQAVQPVVFSLVQQPRFSMFLELALLETGDIAADQRRFNQVTHSRRQSPGGCASSG